MDKNKCSSCGETKCSCKNKDFTKAVIEIDNPEQITLMRRVVIPASMGDDTTVPPVVGKYHNVLLYYEANQKSYLYSSDGIPTLLANGLTDYEQAVNLPQINGITLLGDKNSADLGLQPTLSVAPDTGIKLENNELSGLHATASTIGMVKPGAGLAIGADGTLETDGVVFVFDNIADLRAATNLHATKLATTLGYYTPNDGGGNWFVIRDKEVSDVDDGATTIIVGDLTAEMILGDEISYDQFGAKGDGTTDDYEKMNATHNFANSHNITVIANPEKTYYVKDITAPIPVQTNVDWKGANFIIDDTGTPSKHHLFDVTPTGGTMDFTGEVLSLIQGQDSCNLVGHGNLIVRFENANKKDFIRSGSNADNGVNRKEFVRVDNNGKILDYLYFQFDQVTSILAKKLDEAFITIGNGTFKNIVNTIDSYNYYGRGIMVHRCNVIIEKINHTMEGEDDTSTSSPYSGFICSNFCANLTIKDCNVVAHKQFYTADNTPKGSYDINTEGTVGLLVDNVIQNNDICNSNLWSVHGANYCRDCTFRNSTLSKIDAHKGVYNLYVDNCIVGNRGIGCCGAGKVVIRNTVVNSYRFFYLRDDFGSWFDGTVEIYDCQLNCFEDRNKSLLWAADNDGSHNYGYVCKLPSLKVENFYFNNQPNCNNFNYLYYFSTGDNTNYSVDYDTNAANSCYPQVFDGGQFLDVKNIRTNAPGVQYNGRKMPICPTEIEKLYVAKTGTAENRASTVTPYSKYNPNINNLYINIDNCDLMNPTYDFNRPPDDARPWHSATHCTLWTVYLFANYDSFVNTHRPVMDISIKKCENLFLGVSGRAITFNLEDCTIRQIQGEVSSEPVHMMYCNAKNCKFKVKQADIVDPTTESDPGWIHNHIYTYHFEDCYFDIQTWACGDSDVMTKEAFLYPFRKQDGVMTQIATNINPTFNYSMTDMAATTELLECATSYHKQAQEVLSGVAGDISLLASGSASDIPTGTSGVITNDYGSYVIPTGAHYYDTTNSVDKIFDGSSWA